MYISTNAYPTYVYHIFVRKSWTLHVFFTQKCQHTLAFNLHSRRTWCYSCESEAFPDVFLPAKTKVGLSDHVSKRQISVRETERVIRTHHHQHHHRQGQRKEDEEEEMEHSGAAAAQEHYPQLVNVFEMKEYI